MEDLLQGIMAYGLKRKEAQVYLALLELGQASAQAVAQKAGLKRPTVYVILTDLMKQGLVLKALKQRRHMFIAKQPTELMTNAEERWHLAKKTFPALQAITQKKDKARTLFFEGLTGIREALYYRFHELQGQKFQAFFGDSKLASPELNKLFHVWNADVYKNGITIHSFAPAVESLKAFRKNDVRYGFISKTISPKLYSSRCSIDITPLFVRIIFFEEEQALIIESPDAAKAMAEIFTMLDEKY